jgi:hypothetical protein
VGVMVGEAVGFIDVGDCVVGTAVGVFVLVHSNASPKLCCPTGQTMHEPCPSAD